MQLRPISSDLEKCREIMAIRMPFTCIACRSRSAMAQILYLDVGDLSKTLVPAVKIHNRDIDLTDRHCDKKTRAEHLFRPYQEFGHLSAAIYICIFARIRIIRFFHYFSTIINKMCIYVYCNL